MYTIISVNDKKVGTFDEINGRITTDSPSLKQIVDLWTSIGIRVHTKPEQDYDDHKVMLDGVKIVKLGPDTAHYFLLELMMLNYTLKEESSDPTKSSTKEQEGQTVGDLLSVADNRPRPVEEAMEPFKTQDGEKLQDPPVTPIMDHGVYKRAKKHPTLPFSSDTTRD